MTRTTVTLDRLAALITSLSLLTGAAAAGWWWTGRSGWGETLTTTPATDLVNTGWWPAASAAAGILLILIGLRWIAAHLRRQKITRLRLTGSDASGTLEVNATKIADAAATALADTHGIRTAHGTVRRDRGQLVARLVATIEPEADLAHIAHRADQTTTQLVTALGRDDLTASVQLRTALIAKNLPKVT